MCPRRRKGDATTQRKHLMQTEFFKVCIALKENKEWFLDNRPTIQEAADKLFELTNVEVSKSSVGQIKDATEINWIAKNHGGARATSQPSHCAQRTLVTALVRLYRILGEEPTDALTALYLHLNNKTVEESDSSVQFHNGVNHS